MDEERHKDTGLLGEFKETMKDVKADMDCNALKNLCEETEQQKNKRNTVESVSAYLVFASETMFVQHLDKNMDGQRRLEWIRE